MIKCASCRRYFEPSQKSNGEYYKSCYKCLDKSKYNRKNITDTTDTSNKPNTNIDNTPNTNIDNTNIENTPNTNIDNTPNTNIENTPNTNIDNTSNIDTNIDNTPNIDNTRDYKDTKNIIYEYLNIIRLKDIIIQKLTTENIHLKNIVNDYKITLSQQQTQPQPQPNIKNNDDDRLNDFIKQLMRI